jgi:putative Holliday junction resolvase
MARIGLAVSEGSLALPIEAVPNNDTALDRVLEASESRGVSAIYVGLPISLSGSMTASSLMAIDFAKRLRARTALPIQLIDERLTTKSAQARLHQAGKNTKSSKSMIDAQSAAFILEFALDSERDGKLAGKSLEEFDA